jgi:hypothetical protein
MRNGWRGQGGRGKLPVRYFSGRRAHLPGVGPHRPGPGRASGRPVRVGGHLPAPPPHGPGPAAHRPGVHAQGLRHRGHGHADRRQLHGRRRRGGLPQGHHLQDSQPPVPRPAGAGLPGRPAHGREPAGPGGGRPGARRGAGASGHAVPEPGVGRGADLSGLVPALHQAPHGDPLPPRHQGDPGPHLPSGPGKARTRRDRDLPDTLRRAHDRGVRGPVRGPGLFAAAHRGRRPDRQPLGAQGQTLLRAGA